MGSNVVRPGWITLHDAETETRKRPAKEVRVRASSINTIRPYPDGRVRAVISAQGSYLHVKETEAEIQDLIEQAQWAERRHG